MIYTCKLKHICPTCKHETDCNVKMTTIEEDFLRNHIRSMHPESKIIDINHIIENHISIDA